ncbi:MAG: hypothetical protein AABW73_04445 [Nanoarchaeota archaeon]
MAGKGANMIKNKNNKLLSALVIIAVLTISLVSAFGVAGYDTPVKVKPGESIDLAFRVQNLAGTEDYSLKAEIRGGEGISVTTLDPSTTYSLRHGEIVRVNFRVIMPAEAQAGEKYEVRADFTTGPLNSEGGAPLGIQSIISDKVIIQVAGETDNSQKITPQPEEKTELAKNNSNIAKIVVLATLLAAAILAGYYVRRKNKEKTK